MRDAQLVCASLYHKEAMSKGPMQRVGVKWRETRPCHELRLTLGNYTIHSTMIDAHLRVQVLAALRVSLQLAIISIQPCQAIARIKLDKGRFPPEVAPD